MQYMLQECVSEVDASKSEQPDTGDVSSQTLTFSTKDIREKRPHLIDYIKVCTLSCCMYMPLHKSC